MKTAPGKRTIFAAGLALALPFGLAACGDDEGTDSVTDGQDDANDHTDKLLSDDSSDDDPVGEDTSDEPLDDDTMTDDSGDDALGGGTSLGDGDRPSQDEVRDGVENILSEQLAAMGVTPEQFEAAGVGPAIEDYYTCVADSVYDDVSTDTLQTLAAGDPDTPVFGEDFQTLTDASDTCVETELKPAMP